MKIKVTLKDPDCLYGPVEDAVRADVEKLNLPDDEKELLLEKRQQKVHELIAGRWLEHGEYLTVEFDTAAETATVIART